MIYYNKKSHSGLSLTQLYGKKRMSVDVTDEDGLDEGWTHKRSVKNRKRYNRWIKRLNRLLNKRDRIKSNVNGHLNYQYDEHELENSDQAIIEAIDIEFE